MLGGDIGLGDQVGRAFFADGKFVRPLLQHLASGQRRHFCGFKKLLFRRHDLRFLAVVGELSKSVVTQPGCLWIEPSIRWNQLGTQPLGNLRRFDFGQTEGMDHEAALGQLPMAHIDARIPLPQ